MSIERYLVISPDFPPPFIGGSLVYINTLVNNSNEAFDVLTSKSQVTEHSTRKFAHKEIRTKFLVKSNDPSKIRLFISYTYLIIWTTFKMLTNPYKLVVANPGAIGNSILFILGKFLGFKVVGIAYAEELTIPLKTNGIKNIIKRKIIKYSYKRASGFIVVCHFCKNLLVNEFSVNEKSIDVIPSCLSLEKFSKEKNINKTKNSIISVGRLIERKGFHLLINSVVRLQKKIPDLSLIIVGDGPMKVKLKSLIEKQNAENFIKLKNSVNDEELKDLYQKTQLFVLANYQLINGDTEGCPSVFSEAMNYGMPIIGGKNAGVDTAIIDGENGIIINSIIPKELDEAIFYLLSNVEVMEKMITAGKKKLLRDHHPDSVGALFANSLNRFDKNEFSIGFQRDFNRAVPSVNI